MRTLKHIFPFLILLLLACSAETEKKASVDKQTPIWIDVRTADEFATGHLSEAINIPHTEIRTKIDSIVTDKTLPINVYCRSGHRSGIAKGILEDLGYKNVINEGGYEEILKKRESEKK